MTTIYIIMGMLAFGVSTTIAYLVGIMHGRQVTISRMRDKYEEWEAWQ
jgi:hypothetical protein